MSQQRASNSDQISNKVSSVVQSVETPSLCYFMVADILGFSRMIENLSGSQQAQRIAEWVELVQCAGFRAGVKERQLISDTLFAREEHSADGLARLLKFAQLLLESGGDKPFPLRGAIAQGNAAWGELPYGEAVIEAHTMEQSLDWMGIACAPRLPHLSSLWNWDLVTVYPIPRKTAETRLMPAGFVEGAVDRRIGPKNLRQRIDGGRGLLQMGCGLQTRTHNSVRHLSENRKSKWTRPPKLQLLVSNADDRASARSLRLSCILLVIAPMRLRLYQAIACSFRR